MVEEKVQNRIYIKYIKRLLDILFSGLAIIILSPVFLILALVIKLTSKGPVFFRQDRIGKDKMIFRMLKFRSMKITAPKDVPTHLLEDPEQYISSVGRFLRKTSLDELPQIFHIFTGKMSMIGPRPALYNQDDLVAERDKYGANALRPGLTGYAQINGRDELPIPVKAKLDGEYAAQVSFLTDCKLFFGSIGAVFTSKGVQEGKANVDVSKKEQGAL